jgi:hypothetical protein
MPPPPSHCSGRWLGRGAEPPADEPEPSQPARPAPPSPQPSPPPPPERESPIAGEHYARELDEGYRDGLQYDDGGPPSLARLREEWQAALRRREALERQVARASGEAGR